MLETDTCIKEYETRYKIQPDMVGASAYGAFIIFCDAIKRAGKTDGKAIRNAIADTKNYNALTGQNKGFNDIGEVVKEVQVQTVKEGRFRHFGLVYTIRTTTPKAG